MTATIIVIIKCLAAILVGVFAGNGAVYFFNKIPPGWLCDIGEEPSEEMLDKYHKRISGSPWKFVLTMLFVIIDIKMVMDDWQFSIAGVCAIWLLVVMSMTDIKYRIVPDQLVVLLAVSSVGFMPFHDGWRDMVFGGLIGFGVMGFVAVLGKIIYRKETLGGGDIKLFTALGLVLGVTGILVVFVITTLVSAGHFIWLLARHKIKRTDSLPMVPYIAAAAAIYIIFLWGEVNLCLSI